MTNNEYNDILQFKAEYGMTPNLLGDTCYGLEFEFRGSFYRITKDQMLSDEEKKIINNKFNKKKGIFEVIDMRVKHYMDDYTVTIDNYIGVYDDLDDMLNNCFIDGVKLSEIIISSETTILGKD